MSWTCPKCARTFTRNKQAHSCETHDISLLFSDKSPEIFELFKALISKVQELGPMEVHIAKWNITIRSKTTFMSIFPEKSDLALAIIRDEPLDDFPVYSTYQYSKNRWSNHVKIEEPEEIDDQLLNWIQYAYELCS